LHVVGHIVKEFVTAKLESIMRGGQVVNGTMDSMSQKSAMKILGFLSGAL